MSTSSNIIANIIFDYSSSGLTFGTAPLSSTVAWMVRLSPSPNIPSPLNAVRRLDRQLDSLQRPEPWDGESDWSWYQRKHKYIRVFLAGCRLHERRRRELEAVPHLRRVRHGELTEGYDGPGKVSSGKRRRDGYDGCDPHADRHEVDDSRPAFLKRCTVTRWDERDACMASFVDQDVWLGQLLEGRQIVAHLVVNAHASVAHVKPEEKGDMSFLLRLDLNAARAKAYSPPSVSQACSAASVTRSEDDLSLTSPAPDVMEDQECSASPSAFAAPRSLAALPASVNVSLRRTTQTSCTPARSAKLRIVSSGKENKDRQHRLEAVEKAKARRSKREALKSKAKNVAQAQTPEQAATTETVLSSFLRPEAFSELAPLPLPLAPVDALISTTEATVLGEVPTPEEPVDTPAASVSTPAYASTSGSSSNTPAASANEVETINDLIASTLAPAPVSSPTSAAPADGNAQPLNQAQTAITPAASAHLDGRSLDAPLINDATPSEPFPQEAPTGGSADVAMEEAIDGTDLPMDTDEPADDPIAVAPAINQYHASGQQSSAAEATGEQAKDDNGAGEGSSIETSGPEATFNLHAASTPALASVHTPMFPSDALVQSPHEKTGHAAAAGAHSPEMPVDASMVNTSPSDATPSQTSTKKIVIRIPKIAVTKFRQNKLAEDKLAALLESTSLGGAADDNGPGPSRRSNSKQQHSGLPYSSSLSMTRRFALQGRRERLQPTPQGGGSADVRMEEAIDNTDSPMDTDNTVVDELANEPVMDAAPADEDAPENQESSAEEEPGSSDEATDEDAEADGDAGEDSPGESKGPAEEDGEVNASTSHTDNMSIEGHANYGPSRKGKEKEAAPESKRPITLKLKGWGSTIRKHDEDKKRQADLEDALGGFSLGGSSSSSSVGLDSRGIVAGPSSPTMAVEETMYVEQDSGYASGLDESSASRRQKPNADDADSGDEDAEMPPDSDDGLGGASSA
ncbi:hypothetical protein OE88DRAFT_1805950 [Heliocybe sulcata]|uniref:Uncharacterized protein n=1 Tax=Heliocybe sulcata TaxID=5364 RepID=A0A5C3NBA4_9AGAM|nr:hypothetical protein OE88DRAFT_1805950 [Heliocybe sulcata]